MKWCISMVGVWIAILGFGQESLHINLLDEVDRGDDRYSGSWYYTKDGVEYGLVGAKTGTAIYEITADGYLNELAFIPGPPSNWREITVVSDHAYVVTEGTGAGQGMQVISLGALPNSASLVTTYDATFQTGHIIQKDIFQERDRVYVCGTNTTSGVHILDVSNPVSPEEIGLYQPGYYIHDCHVRGDTLYAAAFYEAKLDFVNIVDPALPEVFNVLNDPGGNTHSCSTTDNGDYLFLADELDGLPGRIFDLSSSEDLDQLALYTANEESLVHNPYIVGNDLAYISHNTEGLRIVDIADPRLPVEVAYFDTYDGASGGFAGLWSACPYLPSGKIIGGDRTRGIMLFQYDQTRAGRLYLQVVDSLSGLPLPETTVLLEADTVELDAEARWSYGALPGTVTLNFFLDQYKSKSLTIALNSGDQLNQVVEMVPAEAGLSVSELPELRVFPNPAADLLRIDGLPESGRLRIYSCVGQLVLEMETQANVQEVVSASWPSGSYVIYWEGASGVRGTVHFVIFQN